MSAVISCHTETKSELHAAFSPQTWQLLSHDGGNRIRAAVCAPHSPSDAKIASRHQSELYQYPVLCWYDIPVCLCADILHVFCCNFVMLCLSYCTSRTAHIYFTMGMETTVVLVTSPFRAMYGKSCRGCLRVSECVRVPIQRCFKKCWEQTQ